MTDIKPEPMIVTACSIAEVKLCREAATGEPRIILTLVPRPGDGDQSIPISLAIDDAYDLQDKLGKVLDGDD